MALKEKQRRFVDEYLVDLNATQAAIRAGYSAKSARFMGAENLTKPNIQEAIQAALAARSSRCQVTQDTVLTGLHDEAKDHGEGSSQTARVRAWELLGKHVGMWKETPSPVLNAGTVIFYLPEKDDDAS